MTQVSRSTMKVIFSRLLLLGLLMLATGLGYAEGNCPAGYYPIGASQGQQGPQGCAPIPGYNQQSASQPPPIGWVPKWESRWGAIATDAAKGSLGTSNSLPSKHEAERTALADCQSKGGIQCKLQIAYDNECAAMVLGDKVFNVTADSTIDKAVKTGMKLCNAANDHTCRVYYSACSPSVRIH